jgi:hypothetical protein
LFQFFHQRWSTLSESRLNLKTGWFVNFFYLSYACITGHSLLPVLNGDYIAQVIIDFVLERRNRQNLPREKKILSELRKLLQSSLLQLCNDFIFWECLLIFVLFRYISSIDERFNSRYPFCNHTPSFSFYLSCDITVVLVIIVGLNKLNCFIFSNCGLKISGHARHAFTSTYRENI